MCQIERRPKVVSIIASSIFWSQYTDSGWQRERDCSVTEKHLLYDNIFPLFLSQTPVSPVPITDFHSADLTLQPRPKTHRAWPHSPVLKYQTMSSLYNWNQSTNYKFKNKTKNILSNMLFWERKKAWRQERAREEDRAERVKVANRHKHWRT